MDDTPRTPGQPSPNQPPVSWAPPPPPRSDGEFRFGDFVSFRYLITPGFITVIYVIGVIFIALGTFASLAVPQGAGGALYALVGFLVLNVFWRIILEFVMVLFRINDSLESIDRRGRGL
jgi:uncharacterized protein DUF4282